MQKYSTLPIGEKLRQIRNSKNLSLENVARAVDTSVSTISRIELGQLECGMEMLAAIKGYMGVSKAPLFNHELKVCEDQLWAIFEFVNANRVSDARDIQKDMFQIWELPFERDLYLFHNMIEVRLLFIEGNSVAAEKLFDDSEVLLEDASTENLNLYYRLRGSFAFTRGELKTAKKYYLQTLELQCDAFKSDGMLHYNLGLLYTHLVQPFHAIKHLEMSMAEIKGDRIHDLGPDLTATLAVNYRLVGELDKAKKLLVEALTLAKSMNYVRSTGISLSHLAAISMKQRNYEDCLALCNEALMLSLENVDSKVYFAILDRKASCLLEMGQITQCREVLAQAKILAEKEDNKDMFILHDAIKHRITIKDSDSSNYIENIVIPHLLSSESGKAHIALEYCEILEAHYKKKGSQKKAMAIAVVARDIYKEMMFGSP